ncbi:MAG: hypothetical protein QM817_22340 [Archangium sp.]
MTLSLALALVVSQQVPLPQPSPLPPPYFTEIIDVAGQTNVPGYVDGAGLTTALFERPRWMATLPSGALWVVSGGRSSGSCAVRLIAPNGNVSTFTFLPYDVTDIGGVVADPATQQLFMTVTTRHLVIRVPTTGGSTIHAGLSIPASSCPTPGACFVGMFADGLATNARFASPRGIVIDGNRDLFVADTDNRAIRKVTMGGFVTTIVPPQAGLHPEALAIDAPRGRLVMVSNSAVYQYVFGGLVTLLAGAPVATTQPFAMTDGEASVARFAMPQGLAVDAAGNVFVADTRLTIGSVNGAVTLVPVGAVRQITPAWNDLRHPTLSYPTSVQTLTLTGGWVQTGPQWSVGRYSDAVLTSPVGLTLINGALAVSDDARQTVRLIRVPPLPQRL